MFYIPWFIGDLVVYYGMNTASIRERCAIDSEGLT